MPEAEEEIFFEIDNRIKKLLPEIKFVDVFNNQFLRSNGMGPDGRKENIPPYPCVFIQIVPEEFNDGLRGFQQTTFTIRFHIGYWSEKDRDFTIFKIKRAIYKTFHKWKPSHNNNWNSLLRRAETLSYDYDNVNVYIMDFTTANSDFDVDRIGTSRVLINPTIIDDVSFTQSQINL